jgi:2-desacetyl-2-hydroxyethyl bacteriochlorophyllide A dehydrogenase
MKRQALWFDGPQNVAVREETLEPPGPGEVLVRTLVSAISSGTEMLFYEGSLEEGAQVDASLTEYRAPLSYPLRYGYASIGRISDAGPGVDRALMGRRAFAFAPHASAFCVPAERALLVPDGVSSEEAAFLANAETAVTLVLDARPMLAERASVFGLGVVGLLTAGLLARFPLERLSGWDPQARRREAGAALGLTTRDPHGEQLPRGTEDFAVEVSGSAQGFRQALASCAFSGRLIVGSWYGTRQPSIDAFDTAFHRSRIRIISSQVSTLPPELSGLWNVPRRFAAAWDAIRVLRPGRWITHTVPFARAADAYRMIAERSGETLQVMLAHEP